MCGYRKGFSTQQALLALTENWGKSLDNKGFGGALLMDLSKAFATLNHELLIAKLHAYGFNRSSIKFLHSYFSNRWYKNKVNNKFSFWTELLKDAPQGLVFRSSSFQYILK